jgi:hypothetical protein
VDNFEADGSSPETETGDTQKSKAVDETSLNRTITARQRKLEEKLTKQFEAKTAELLSRFDELLGSKGMADGEPSQPAKSASKAEDITEHPSYKALTRKLGELESRWKKADEEVAAERRKSRETSAKATLSEKLANAGIEGTRAKLAIGHLFDSAKVARFNEAGELVVAIGDEEHDLDEGLKKWLSTDEAKVFQPPRGAQGSGEVPQGRSRKGSAADSSEALQDVVLKHFFKQ